METRINLLSIIRLIIELVTVILLLIQAKHKDGDK